MATPRSQSDIMTGSLLSKTMRQNLRGKNDKIEKLKIKLKKKNKVKKTYHVKSKFTEISRNIIFEII